MRKLTRTLLMLGCFSLCIGVCANAYAQDNQPNKDAKYLAGAIPEVDGKVVFTKEYSIPGMTQEEIYTRLQGWMEARLKKNENNSRVVYTNPEKGQIVGMGDEWIVFSSTALSLDRTRILYQLTATCQSEQCQLEVSKVRFIYREGEERYTAEEWITDKYALNKSKTKLVRGLAKWRRKTVDFVDNLGVELAEALSASPTDNAGQEPRLASQEEPSAASNGPVVIVPKQQVITTAPQQQAPVAQATAGTGSYREIAPADLPSDAIQTSAGKLVIVIGTDPFNMTMMTANAGGSIGKMEGKPVVFSILSPDQPCEQLEGAETYTVRFYPNGQNEPSIVLECKKMPSPASVEGMPKTFIGEIIKATVK